MELVLPAFIVLVVSVVLFLRYRRRLTIAIRKRQELAKYRKKR